MNDKKTAASTRTSNNGNGAREALMSALSECFFIAGSARTDELLICLWQRGFKIVPLGEDTPC